MKDFGMGAAQWGYDRMEPREGFYVEPEPEPALEPFEDKWDKETEEGILKRRIEREENRA